MGDAIIETGGTSPTSIVHRTGGMVVGVMGSPARPSGEILA
jgi:hypothetical protein